MKKNKPCLYIPIETKVRELHGKLLLASFAAINGFNVVIGSKKDIHARAFFLPRGTIFNVGLAKNLAKNSKKYKQYGHKVVAIDEEGIVTLNDGLYVRHRVSEDALNVTDAFFCWGKRQANLIEKKAKKTSCNLSIVGNPRFDMLRPEYKVIFSKDVDEIKRKYGRFILVNTNFGHGNHFAGDDFLLESFYEKGWMDNSDDKEFFLKNIDWQKGMFKKFLEMIPMLAENFQEYKIVIRPHPSENHEAWKKMEQKFPNVFVVHSGNVIPWLMAADVLVHNGCTTAVESFLLGTKAVAYRPFIVAEQETELPNEISTEAHDLKKLVSILKKVLNKSFNSDDEKKREFLGLFLSGFSGKTASEKMADILKSESQVDKKQIINFSLVFFELLNCARKILGKVLLRTNNNTASFNYQLHKTPNLSKKEIKAVIRSLSKIEKRFLNLRIRKIGGTCHYVYEK